ncbi:MAG: hypothetical protein HY016_12675 [Nitrosomonadales bacterium]|nr:hypothetical protein [Nitrosomonadales bacterium]
MGDRRDTGRLNEKSGNAWSLLGIAVLATAAAGLLYFGYFQLSPWIWSRNQPFRPEDVTVWQLLWLEDRDGVELYALYALMFLNLMLVCALSLGWRKWSGGSARYFLVIPLALACAFVAAVGFQPPMNTLASHALSDILAKSFTVMAVVLPLTALLYYLQQRYAYWVQVAAAALLLIPVCFIATAPIEWYDYSFMLAPALRLLHGAGISEIYLPYDLLLSLIGWAWMKLRLDLNAFQVVGQFSFYFLLLGLFVFSRRWFLDKRLAVFLLVAAVLVRIYAGPGDAVHSFQLTPLRLDLWLILLALVYFKGPHHWSAGLYCGLLLVLHKNFGIIYSAAYVQLVLTLCLLDTLALSGKARASAMLGTLCKKNYHNFALILLSAFAHYLLFRDLNEAGDFSFKSLGISFTKITAQSFYWYAVVVSGLAFALLLRLRARVSANYLATGIFLIYLAIGNSLYFFGRSHENNIINISVILLLLFFLLVDMVGHFLAQDAGSAGKSFVHRNPAMIVALVFIAAITIWYGDNISNKAAAQVRNAARGQFIYPSEVTEPEVLNVIARIQSVTGDNPRVYFVGDYDFLLSYYGGYAPVGYYNPVYAWISKREFDKSLQGLVDQGYYLVIDNGLTQEVLPSIRFSNHRDIGGRLIVWK